MAKAHKEEPRIEYGYWHKAKNIFMEGIDKNKTLPDHCKRDLKELVSEQFRIIGKTIGTFELLYLREKQSDEQIDNT
jgi:hypothetical protein